MNLTPLVPEKTYAVCTNGLIKGTMVVGSQTTTMKMNGNLIATQFDKPTNFKCVYLGILIAIIGGFIAAMMASGVGALIGGIVLATVFAAALTYGLGGAVCSYCLKSSEWTIYHPNVIIEEKHVIISTSQIICTPLGFLPSGVIALYYSEEIANRVAEIYRWRNYVKIFAGANLGASVFGLGSLGVGIAAVYGTTAGIATVLGFLGLGYFINKPINDFQEWVSDSITGRESEEYYERNLLLDPISGSNAPGFDLSVRQGYLTEYGTAQGTVTMSEMWVLVKADSRYYPGMPSSELNALKSEYLHQQHQQYDVTKNSAANRRTIGEGIRNALVLLGFNIFANTLMQCIYKNKENELEELEDLEIDAKMNVGIFEIQI